MVHDDESAENRKAAAGRLERQVRLLERKLARSEESRVHLEKAKDKHDSLYNNLLGELGEQKALLADKNRMLEALSAKLAKYLSPQVYQSIFTGQQDVALETRRKKLAKDPAGARELPLLERIQEALESERAIREIELTADERKAIAGYTFLSQKPLLLVLNVAEEDVAKPAPETVAAAARARGLGLVVLSAAVEMDIAQMQEAEQAEFLTSLGVGEPARDRFIRGAYAADPGDGPATAHRSGLESSSTSATSSSQNRSTVGMLTRSSGEWGNSICGPKESMSSPRTLLPTTAVSNPACTAVTTGGSPNRRSYTAFAAASAAESRSGRQPA